MTIFEILGTVLIVTFETYNKVGKNEEEGNHNDQIAQNLP